MSPAAVLRGTLDGEPIGLICPTGCSSVSLSSRRRKNILLSSLLKSLLCLPPSCTRQRGVRVVTDVERGTRWTQQRVRRSALTCVRRSRVVLTPRRWRSNWRRCLRITSDDASHRTEVMSLRIALMMVARKPGHQGELEGNRNTIVQGMPGRFRRTCGRLPCAFYLLHTGLRVLRAPGIPCALVVGHSDDAKLGRNAPRECRCLSALLFDRMIDE